MNLLKNFVGNFVGNFVETWANWCDLVLACRQSATFDKLSAGRGWVPLWSAVAERSGDTALDEAIVNPMGTDRPARAGSRQSSRQSWGQSWSGLIIILALLLCAVAHGADKSGVSPNTISLPKGPGSIEGLGESFQPTLNTGTAKDGLNLKLPPGVAGHQPALSLSYDGGGANGSLGFGWALSLPCVQRRTDNGIPTYGADVGFPRTDVFINEAKEELVPQANGFFFCKNEGTFVRYRQVGDHWEATLPDGTKLDFGLSAAGRIEEGARVFCWLLQRETDTHGNVIEYSYRSFAGEQNLNQKYLALVRYGPGPALSESNGAPAWTHFHFATFQYEDRSDWFEDGRAGFLVRTGKRLKSIAVGSQGATLPGHLAGDFDSDGATDYLNRRYDLAYLLYAGTNSHWSLLEKVTMVGADGVTALPSARYSYAVCNPPAQLSAQNHILVSTNEPIAVMDNPFVDLVDLNADGLPDMLRTELGGAHVASINRGPVPQSGSSAIQWSDPVPVDAGNGTAWNFDLASDLTHLADMDGDGLADLVHKTADDQVFYFANRGRLGWSARHDMALENTVPPAPFGNPGVTTADVDFDKRIDIIQSLDLGGSVAYRVWFNLENQNYSTPQTVEPEGGFNLALPGVQVVDCNGDRVPDVARIRPGAVLTAAGLGYGHFAAPQSMVLPDVALDDQQIAVAKLTDINGDGLADLVLERAAPGVCHYWLNLGNYTFSPRKEIVDLPIAVSPNAAVRWADLNGNGSTDLIYADSQATSRLQAIDMGEVLTSGLALNALTQIDNGIGRVIRIDYAASTRFALEDAAAGQPWPDPLPFPVTVVAGVTVSDSLGHEYRTEFRYHDGYYDEAEKQFRGFARVEQIDVGDSSAPTLVTRSHFDTGRTFEAMKGKVLRQTVEQTNGQVFWDEITTWANPPRTLMTGTNGQAVLFAHPTAMVKDVVELGQGEPRRLESETAYDNFGNPARVANYGIVEGTNRAAFNDERIATTEYAINTNAWIIRLPKRQQIADENGLVISRTESFYDDETFSGNNLGSVTIGNPTFQRAWITPASASAFVKSGRTKYDTYGNPIAVFDPLSDGSGNTAQGHFRELTYDNEFHSYPTRETIHVGGGKPLLIVQATYDQGLATMTSSTDFNGHLTSYGYDALGRMIHVVRPGDTFDFPTAEYRYGLAVPAGPNRLVNFVETRRRDQSSISNPKADMYFFSREFVDGLGRKLMSKSEAEPGQGSATPRVILSQATSYNARHKPAFVLNPCFSVQGSGTLQEKLAFEDIAAPGWQGAFQVGSNLMTLNLSAAPKASLSYDPTLRSTTETNQDGTFRRTIYEPLVVRSYDENQSDPASSYYQNSMVRHADGLGRLVRVDEVTPLNDDGTRGQGRNTWTTLYQYDLNDRLTGIIDSLNNVKTIAYDGLKRKTFMNDPDRGQLHYVYDDASNLLQTRDAKNQLITFTYDGVNRILTEDHGSAVPPWRDSADTKSVSYVYDTPVTNLPQGDNTTATAHNTRGMLAYVRDLSGEEHLSYDACGRTEYTIKRIPDPVFLSSLGSQLSVPLVSFRTKLDYDPLDRITRLVFPDNDEVRYEFNERNLVRRISGGPNTNIISSITYLPSGQRRQVNYGNGVRVTSDFDARLRQTMLDAGHTSLGTKFISFSYDFDPVSNIRSITDLRPTSLVPAADPRRNTQAFTYDDLYRLTKAQYNAPNSATSNGGELAYRYNRIANLLAQTSDISQNENGLSVTQLGELAYGGTAGSSGRVGRAPNDPPGPHALSSVQHAESLRLSSGQVGIRNFSYDANGNMTAVDGLTNFWDYKDRIVACENAEMRAQYNYDYSGRRILKRVWSKPSGPATEPTCVVYVNPTFELRDYDAPTKFVFNAATRVARVTGSLSTNPRLQRLRVYPGWNLCSLAVTTTNALAQFSAGNPQLIRAAYRWSATTSNWAAVAANETLPQGTVLWVNAATNAVLAAFGPYLEPTSSPVPAGGTFLPCAGLQVWSLTNGLPANLTAWLRASPPELNAWKTRFPSALASLSTLPFRLAPGQVVFVQSESNALPQLPAPASRISYYLQDHLGSSSVITDANGMLVEETAFYPSGLPRHRYDLGPDSDPYQFAQKERDEETGLWHFQARYLASQLSRFISVDPKYVDPESDILAQPQLLNLYAFAACNPLKYADPDGLEVVWSREMQQNRQFMRALNIVKSSSEGRRVLAALQNVNVPAANGPGEHETVAGYAHIRTEFGGSDRTGWTRRSTVSIAIDLDKAARDGMTDHELANVIHHELRHTEIHAGPLQGEDLSTWAKVQESEKRRARMDKNLDVYIPATIQNGKGTGVQTLDDRNHTFQVEIGLRKPEAEEMAIHNAAKAETKRQLEEYRAKKAAKARK